MLHPSVCPSVYTACPPPNRKRKLHNVETCNWHSNFEVKRAKVKVTVGGKRRSYIVSAIGTALTCCLSSVSVYGTKDS